MTEGLKQGVEIVLEHRPPPLRRLLREAFDLPLVLAAPLLPLVRSSHRGMGIPVLVIPGFGSNDHSIDRLVRSLNAAGFAATGWGQQTNLGYRPELLEGLAVRLNDIVADRGSKIILVGWSLGGLFARETAKLHPELVSMVVTLGSPFSGCRRNNNAWRLYEAINDHSVDNPPIASELAEKPSVPTFALWSQRDGIVSTGSAHGLCHESDARIQLDSTHLGMATRSGPIRQIVQLLSDRLAEPRNTDRAYVGS